MLKYMLVLLAIGMVGCTSSPPPDPWVQVLDKCAVTAVAVAPSEDKSEWILLVLDSSAPEVQRDPNGNEFRSKVTIDKSVLKSQPPSNKVVVYNRNGKFAEGSTVPGGSVKLINELLCQETLSTRVAWAQANQLKELGKPIVTDPKSDKEVSYNFLEGHVLNNEEVRYLLGEAKRREKERWDRQEFVGSTYRGTGELRVQDDGALFWFVEKTKFPQGIRLPFNTEIVAKVKRRSGETAIRFMLWKDEFDKSVPLYPAEQP